MVQRIRTIKSIASRYAYYAEGTVLHVPEDIDEATALSWLKGHLAEEDKMLDGPPETKVEPEVPKRKRRK